MKDFIDDYLVLYAKIERLEELDLRVLHKAIENIYGSVNVSIASEDILDSNKLIILTVSRWSKVAAEPIKKDNFIAVSSGIGDTSTILKSVKYRQGNIIFDKSVNGIYSTTAFDVVNKRLLSWTSRPSIKKVYYSSYVDGIGISSDPLLLASCLDELNIHRRSLNHDYINSILAFGYPMYEHTPYVNIYLLPPEKYLSISSNFNLKIHKASYYNNIISFDENNAEDTKAQALSNQMFTFLSVAKINDKKPLLRLSGGKDSRCLLSVLSHYDSQYLLETRSSVSDTEFEVARCLSDSVGVNLKRSVPKLAKKDSIKSSVEDTLRRTHGLCLAETHQIMYQGAGAINEGQLLLMGHSHIQRGGFAKTMKNSLDQSLSSIHGQCSKYVNNSIKEEYDNFVKTWVNENWTTSYLEMQYEFHVQYRAGSYLIGHYTDYSNEAILAYPMVEQGFVNVCDNLSMFDKVSERVVFKMIQKLNPSLISLPLKDARWRFEAHGKADLAPETYDLRSFDNIVCRENYNEEMYNSLAFSELENARNYVLNSKYLELIKSKLDPIIAVSLFEGNLNNVLENVRENQSFSEFDSLRKFIWRVYTAVIWLEGNWLNNDI